MEQKEKGNAKGAKERVLSWLLNRLIASSNRDLNIAELQARHGAYARKVTRLEVTDLGRAWQFVVANGKLEMVPESEPAAGGFSTTSDTLIAMALGKRRMADPANPQRTWEAEYTPIDALKMGDLTIWGDAASNEALLFARAVYRDAYPKLREALRPEAGA